MNSRLHKFAAPVTLLFLGLALIALLHLAP
jgi:hypothetical protein